jgi:hypothetical protein
MLYYNVLLAWGLGEGLQVLTVKTFSYEILHRASEFAGPYEHGNEPSGSIKGRELLDQMSDS